MPEHRRLVAQPGHGALLSRKHKLVAFYVQTFIFSPRVRKKLRRELMNWMRYAACISVLIVLALLLWPDSSQSARGKKQKVTIFYSSDICGYLEPCG